MLQSRQPQIILSLPREDKEMRRNVAAAITLTQSVGRDKGLDMGSLDITAGFFKAIL